MHFFFSSKWSSIQYCSTLLFGIAAFCYTARGNTEGEGTEKSCSAKEGNPFGPFWDTYNIDFVGSEFYGPLHYDIHHSDMAKRWDEKYPPQTWPGEFELSLSSGKSLPSIHEIVTSPVWFVVLAFTGAPASFPVQLENRDLHKYLMWSENILKQAKHFIKKKLPRGAFVGIHLRNGIDWVRFSTNL